MNRYNSHTPLFSMYRCAQCVPTSDCTHSLIPHLWIKVKLIVCQKNCVHPSRATSLAMHGTLSTSSSSFSSMSVLQKLRTSRNPCADSQEPRGDGYTDPELRTGYEPKKRIVDNQIIYEQEDKTCTEDNQITEIEGHVKSFSYNQSLFSSKALLHLKKQTWTTNQFVLLVSPRHLPEQEASAERSQVCHSEREGLMSSSSQGLNFICTRRPVALFSHQSQLNQDAFSERRNLLMF